MRSSIVSVRFSTSSVELDPDGRCVACAVTSAGTKRWMAPTAIR